MIDAIKYALRPAQTNLVCLTRPLGLMTARELRTVHATIQ